MGTDAKRGAAQGVEALEGEGWPCTVADQALDARSVVALDADSGVDAEAAGALPDPPALAATTATRAE